MLILIGFLGLIVYYFYPESKLDKNQKADKIIINKSDALVILRNNISLPT